MDGRKLRQIRERLGMTQAELGRVLGVSFVTISHYETGKRRITKRTELALKRVVEEAA